MHTLSADHSGNPIIYPVTPMEDVVDIYHGVKVTDPYRWLEEEGPQRKAWIAKQREFTKLFVPEAALVTKIRTRLDGYMPPVINYAVYRYGQRRFFLRMHKGKNYPQTIELLESGEERVIVDPNEWSDNGAVSPAGKATSPQGNYICIAKSTKSNDLQEWSVLDVSSGKILKDTLPLTMNTAISWLEDESGFFYAQILDDGRRSIYFHTLGSTKEADRSVFTPATDDSAWYSQSLSLDNSELYVYKYVSDAPNSVAVFDIQSRDVSAVYTIEDITPNRNTVILQKVDNGHIVMTNDDAVNGHVVVVKQSGKRDVLIATSENVLTDAVVVAGRIVLTYYTGTSSFVKVFDLEGKEQDLVNPTDEIGMVTFDTQDYKNPECYIYIESPIRPPSIYGYNVQTNQLKLYKASEYTVDPSRYDVQLDYATSKDGTKIPIFLCRAKTTIAQKAAPTILYGYGGFEVNIEPTFNDSILPWLDAGGVYVSACLRGGEEFGSAWHEAGMKAQKQIVFDDFIACAEHLVDSGITTKELLTTSGGSNGGLLVAATMLQRPELMHVVLPSAGLLDMIRYDKGDHARSGVHWRSEYGTTDTVESVRNLLSYSPVHNVLDDHYPIVYASVGEDDDRVLPSNTYKFIASLQAHQKANNPILVDIESSSGHTLPGRERQLTTDARQYAFLFKEFGMTP